MMQRDLAAERDTIEHALEDALFAVGGILKSNRQVSLGWRLHLLPCVMSHVQQAFHPLPGTQPRGLSELLDGYSRGIPGCCCLCCAPERLCLTAAAVQGQPRQNRLGAEQQDRQGRAQPIHCECQLEQMNAVTP